MMKYLFSLFLLAQTMTLIAQDVRFDNLPRHLQFMPRDSQDSALITVSGAIQTSGYDSVYLVLYRSIDGVTSKIGSAGSGRLTYSAGSAPFLLNTKIHSELAEYKIEIMAAPEGLPAASHILLTTVDSLVSGDVFLIAGQSNAHPANTLATYQDEYCRSFGIQTPGENYSGYYPSDTLWGYANGHGFGGTFSGPYLVGVWGIRLMQYVRDSFHIPVCIINGGAGGSNILMNLPSTDHLDLSSIYGRLLYRVQKAGLQNSIRAIFWYQGESDIQTDTSVYSQRFSALRAAWKSDYGPVSKIYLPQIHPGCPYIGGGLIREFQRTINKKFPEIQPMSTVSLPDHDGCHYSKAAYDIFAYQAFRLVARDFYGSQNTFEIEAPNILHAYYPDRNKNTIRLLFEKSNALSLTSTPGKNISDYFYLDSDTGRVIQTDATGATVTLKLRDTLTATRLTYLPDNYYNNTDSYYEGPFIVNANGIGAFSFYGKAIENNTAFQAPVANFGYDVNRVLAEIPISLLDSSLEWPTSYQWSAPGATISSPTAANPSVTFPAAGSYSVSLTVTNSLGSNTISKTITVLGSGSIYSGGIGRGEASASLMNQALPVELVSFNAAERNCAAQLSWKIARESNLRVFEIQRSVDGVEFVSVASVSPQANASYSVLLAQSESLAYYRLKMIDRDGKFSYSNLQSLALGCDFSKEVLAVSPNPVRSGALTTVTYESANDKGRGTLRLLSGTGREVYRMAVPVGQGVNTYRFKVPVLGHGIYYIKIDAAGGNLRGKKIVVLGN